MTTDDLDTVKTLTQNWFLQGKQFTNVDNVNPQSVNVQQVANNKKVEGHTALLPTGKLDQDAYSKLAEQQQQVITLIVNRLWQATGQPRIHETIKVTATINGINYTASSDTTINPWWTQYKPTNNISQEAKQQIPESLYSGQSVPRDGEPTIEQGETKPPAHYTDATLLSAMEHASKQLDDKELKAALDDDSVHSGGIGTPATRASIIDKLIKNRYAERKGNQILATSEGETLITIVAPSLKAVETTARMEQGLTAIAHMQLDQNQWLNQIHQQARQILPDAQQAFKPEYKKEEPEQESVGKCPVCGNPIIKTRGGFYKCSNNKSQKNTQGKWEHVEGSCTYGIWKKTIGNNGKKLTESLIKKTLSRQQPRVKNAFHSARTGKDYDMILIPDTKWGIEATFKK